MVKLHEDFKKKHDLSNDWIPEIMDSEYTNINDESLEKAIEIGEFTQEVIEDCLDRYRIEGGYIATIINEKTNEKRAYFIHSSEKFNEAQG